MCCSSLHIRRGYVDSHLTHLACIIAATIHDVDHKVGGWREGGQDPLVTNRVAGMTCWGDWWGGWHDLLG